MVARNDDELTDALLIASRALVAVAARSLADVDEQVTLPQYRALVVASTKGPQTVGALAEELGIHRSTATRLCDRLVAKRLVTRREGEENRRETIVTLTAAGTRIVDAVTSARRSEIARIVRRIPVRLRQPAIDALNSFAAAAGEAAVPAWSLGWSS